MTKLSQPIIIAVLALVAVIVIASAILGATANPIPAWFENLAVLLVGGALGAYQAPPTNSGVGSGLPAGSPPAPAPAATSGTVNG